MSKSVHAPKTFVCNRHPVQVHALIVGPFNGRLTESKVPNPENIEVADEFLPTDT